MLQIIAKKYRLMSAVKRNEMVCNPMCGEPPASGVRVCSMGARGGDDECGCKLCCQCGEINKAFMPYFMPHDGQHKGNGLVYFLALDVCRQKISAH
jgi:hypothetical protein